MGTAVSIVFVHRALLFSDMPQFFRPSLVSARVGDRLSFVFGDSGRHRIVQVTGATSCRPVASSLLGDGLYHSVPQVMDVKITSAMAGVLYVVSAVAASLRSRRLTVIHLGMP